MSVKIRLVTPIIDSIISVLSDPVNGVAKTLANIASENASAFPSNNVHNYSFPVPTVENYYRRQFTQTFKNISPDIFIVPEKSTFDTTTNYEQTLDHGHRILIIVAFKFDNPEGLQIGLANYITAINETIFNNRSLNNTVIGCIPVDIIWGPQGFKKDNAFAGVHVLRVRVMQSEGTA